MKILYFWRGLDMSLIIGFLAVDFLIFHDIFKPGEMYTPVELLVGILSIVVILRALFTLKF